ncbi:MAG TPA: glycosyltransferase [Candidatus Eisenbacteria bacterium]|nr:glycosyltransferase [Candidatus Eisenbacteria bacterium]
MSRKILLVTGWYRPESVGGTETYVGWLAADLKALGYDARIAAPSTDEREMDYEHEGIPVHRYPVSRNPSRDELSGKSEPAFFDVFRRWAAADRPDLVHFHSYGRGCGLPHAEFFRGARVPVVVTAHTPLLNCARGTMTRWGTVACDGLMRPALCGACYLQSRGVPRPLAWAAALAPGLAGTLPDGRLRTALTIRRAMERRRAAVLRFLDIAGSVIVVCRWLEEAFRLNGVPDEKLVLLRQGLPARQTPPRVPSGGPVRIGYLGRLHPSKGVDVLVRSFVRLPSRTEAELHLYGGAQDEASRAYEKRLRALAGADPRIRFHGPVPQSETAQALRDLDALAVPSLWMETGPLVALESFSVGTPVIGSGLGSLPEIVTDGVNGLIVPPGDVEAWTRTLERVSADRGLLRRLSEGRPEIKTSAEVARKTAALYEKAFQRREAA